MESIYFKTSLLAFWLKKSVVSFDSNSVKINRPNILFNVIPAGEVNETIPVSQIASVDSAFACSLGGIIGGFFLVFMPYFWLCAAASEASTRTPMSATSVAVGFIAMIPVSIIGIMLVSNSLRVNVRITTTSGMKKWLSVLFFEKQKAVQIEGVVNSLISNRMDDTNTRMQNEVLMADNAKNTDKIISGIADAIKTKMKDK